MIEERRVEVPMRDGAVLRADVYRPEGDEPVPAVLARTCYNRSLGPTPPASLDPERAVAAGLALVCQDVRGRFESDGDFYPFEAEGRDGYDTIAWLAEQPWCNGAVGMAGRSYPAANQWLAAAERPEALRAIAPVVIGSDFYHGWVYQGGAFQLGFNLFWLSLMTGGRTKPALSEQFRVLPLGDAPLLHGNPAARCYHDWLAHQTDDEFWHDLSPSSHYERVQIPVLNVGGWYDVFLGGTLRNFTELRRRADGDLARAGTRLLIGPWAHGSAWGSYPDHRFEVFGDEQGIDLDGLQLDFFARYLGGDGGAEDGPPVRLFVMGVNRWRDEADWPLARARDERWYLHAGGALTRESPGEEAPDRFVYDPADPAPTIGGPTSLPGRMMRTNAGPLDQAPLLDRDDVLVFDSEVLTEPLEVTGPLSLVLHAATSAPDTDFVAKLCDVDPDGFCRILTEGVLRARYLGGFDAPRPVTPGEPLEVPIDLVATSNVFLAGHRIRLIVTSSSFPRFDRNANSGNPVGADSAEDLRVAEQTVFHDGARPSHLVLPVVDG